DIDGTLTQVPAAKTQLQSPPQNSAPQNMGNAGNSTSGGNVYANKSQATAMTRQARQALQQGDIARAEQIAREAEKMMPDSAFGPQEDRPSLVLFDIQKAKMNRNASGVVHAAGRSEDSGSSATRALYMPEEDGSRMVVAAGTREQPEPRLALNAAQADLAQNSAAPRPLDPSASKVEVRGPGAAVQGPSG